MSIGMAGHRGKGVPSMHPLLFWSVFPICWITLLGFPFIGMFLAMSYEWGWLYYPAAFGFLLWATEWGQLMEYVPQRTWRDHIGPVVQGAAGGPLVFVGFIVVFYVVGLIIEGGAHYSTELARCKRAAVTPQEHHQCR